jgi:transposase
MQKEQQVFRFKRWQILLAVASNRGQSAEALSLLLGCSAHVIKRTVQRYNKTGATFLDQAKWGGRRQKRCLLSFEQEAGLLQSWEARALEGRILVAKHLRAAVEQQLGHAVSNDYLWDLLHRHGWSKKAPRPQHPKAEQVAEQREAFKKKSLNYSLQKTPKQSP